MATEDGTALLGFGTTTVTGYIVEQIQEPIEGEDLEIHDEDGDVVTHINSYGISTNVTLTVIPKDGTAAPAIGDTFTYTSQTNGVSQKFTVLSVDPGEANRDVVRWSISGKSFPNVTIV